MGGISMQVEVEGADKAVEQLGGLEARLADRAPLMSDVAAYMESSTVMRFKSNIAPSGAAWKPSIRVLLKGGRTLVNRGLYRDSFTSDSGEDFAEVGTNAIQARLMQFGGTVVPKTGGGTLHFNIPGVGWRRPKKVTIPARPHVGLSQVDRVEILDMTGDYLAGGLGGS